MGLVKFITKTAAQYEALQNKDNDALYFITDTKKIFKGSVEYCEQDGSPEDGTMVIRGNLTPGAGGSVLVPVNYKKGDVYRFTSSGLFESTPVDSGDMAVAMADSSGSSRGSDFEIYRSTRNIHETVWE